MELNPFELIECGELEDKRNVWGFEHSYKDILKSITNKVNWTVEGGFEDYQGDFFYLGEDQEGFVYYVTGGYGSCSGCDALEACDTYEDLLELRDDMKRSIRKFDRLNEFEEWFNTLGQTEWYTTCLLYTSPSPRD